MDISLSSDALDIAFSPASSSNLLATGLISGKISLLDYTALSERQSRSRPGSASDESSEEDEDDDYDEDDDDDSTSTQMKGKGKAKLCEKKWTIRPSNNSCRGVYFDQDGTSLFSVSKDGSLFRIDTETGSIVSQWKRAHEAAPSRLISIEPNLLATGDDDGAVCLWDPRKSSTTAVRSYTHHFDWITSMLWCQHLAPPKAPKLSKEEREKKQIKDEKKRRRKDRKKDLRGEGEADEEEEEVQSAKSSRERLVCTSGDGTLSVIDIRSGPSGVDVSEDQEDELLSIASVKQDTKLVVGTQLGILSLWAPTRGLLDHIDRIPGHPASVDAMCTLDHDTVLTGSSDGLVRVVQILPHKLLGIVADHGGLPVERLARKDNWLASVGHGAEVKLTDLSPLLEDEDEDDDDEGKEEKVEEEGEVGAEEAGGIGTSSEQVGLQMGDAEEEEESSEEEDDDSDSEEESKAKPAPKKSRLETILSQGEAQQDPNQSFFADL